MWLTVAVGSCQLHPSKPSEVAAVANIAYMHLAVRKSRYIAIVGNLNKRAELWRGTILVVYNGTDVSRLHVVLFFIQYPRIMLDFDDGEITTSVCLA